MYRSVDDGCTWGAVRSDAAASAVAARGGLTVVAFDDEQLLVGRGGAWSSYAWDRGRGRIVSLGVSTEGALFFGCLADRSLVWRSNDAGRCWSIWLRCARG